MKEYIPLILIVSAIVGGIAWIFINDAPPVITTSVVGSVLIMQIAPFGVGFAYVVNNRRASRPDKMHRKQQLLYG